MSLIMCDHCKGILDEPMYIPCGFNVCHKHIQTGDMFKPMMACHFCGKLHHDPYVKNQKLADLISLFNNAKLAHSSADQKLKTYNDLKTKPAAYIDAYFDRMQAKICAEKEKLVKKAVALIEERCQLYLNDLVNFKNSCMNSLEVKRSLEYYNETDPISVRLGKYHAILKTNKISENFWEQVIKDSKNFEQELSRKIDNIQRTYLLDRSYDFTAKAVELNSQMFDFGAFSIVDCAYDTLPVQPTTSSMNTNANNGLNEPHRPNGSAVSTPAVSNLIATAATSNMATPPNRPPRPTVVNAQSNGQLVAKRYIRILGHINFVYCLCFDRTGDYLFTGSDDKLIKIWRVSDGFLLYTMRGHGKEISDLDVNYENTLLASGGNDRRMFIWNIKTGQPVLNKCDHSGAISYVKFLPSCSENIRWLVTAGYDGAINFYKYSSRTLDFEDSCIKFNEYSKIVSISYSKGGNFVVTGRKDGVVTLFYITKNEPKRLAILNQHNVEVNSVSFSNHSIRFLTGSKDGLVQLWNYRGKKWSPTIIQLENTQTRQSSCNMVAWNSNDSLIITAEKDNNLHKIKVWNANDSSFKFELKFHTDNIFVLEPHPTNPSLLLSGSHDGFIVLWNLDTGENLFSDYNEIGERGEHGGICESKWSPRGDLFALSDSHGHLSMFGYGSNRIYENTPVEQFFHTDYMLITRERNTIVDQLTRLPPHLMPYPFMVNLQMTPHSIDVQRKIIGKSSLTDEEFQKHLVIKDGQTRIADFFEEVTFRSENLCLKQLIEPLNESQLNLNQSIRTKIMKKEEEIIKAEFSTNESIQDVENPVESRAKKLKTDSGESNANATGNSSNETNELNLNANYT